MNRVEILLSAYNGGKYIKEQIVSLLQQKGVEIVISVRDDGSSDDTCHILNDYQRKGILRWYNGDNLKPAMSFMDLLFHSGECDFYAFCDQDDIWLEDKLNVATEILSQYPEDKPALYFSAKRLVDADLNIIKDTTENPLLTLEESFIYNPATGCTIVINKALRDVIMATKVTSLPSLHDSWVYRTCLAVGGHVYYDPNPHILYRQHGGNVVGHTGVLGRFKAFCESIEKTGGTRSCVAKSILDNYNQYLTEEAKLLLQKLANYRSSFWFKFSLFFNPQMRTKSKLGAITFRLYLLLNKY